MQIESISYAGWKQTIRITNSAIELVVPVEIGPRIMHFGFRGGANLLYQNQAELGLTGDNKYHFYGGHRLWQAPETMARTYVPDNQPIDVQDHNDFIRLVQSKESSTGTQKEIDIALIEDAAKVQITHRLRNFSSSPVELAPWAVTQLIPGGIAVLPLPALQAYSHERLLPTYSLAAWCYTDWTDPRLQMGKNSILIRQDSRQQDMFKIGLKNRLGWMAYAASAGLFVKRTRIDPDGRYPDAGSSHEVYVDQNLLELETLGPLVMLPPDGEVTHVEDWYLFPPVSQLEGAELVAGVIDTVTGALEGGV